MSAPALRYILRRLAQAPLVLLIVVVLQFFVLHLAPGDVADVIAGEAQSADPEFIKKLRADLGLDQPIVVQLGLHIWRVLRLDLGNAHSFGVPVVDQPDASKEFAESFTFSNQRLMSVLRCRRRFHASPMQKAKVLKDRVLIVRGFIVVK